MPTRVGFHIGHPPSFNGRIPSSTFPTSWEPLIATRDQRLLLHFASNNSLGSNRQESMLNLDFAQRPRTLRQRDLHIRDPAPANEHVAPASLTHQQHDGARQKQEQRVRLGHG